MKISAKSRYALAALIKMGQENAEEKSITILSLSENLGISKIYLEQVFSLLKRGEILTSTKGSRGGYQFARPTSEISVYDILHTIEFSLFQPAEQTVAKKSSHIENVMQDEIFAKLDNAVAQNLRSITLSSLVEKTARYNGDAEMYYI